MPRTLALAAALLACLSAPAAAQDKKPDAKPKEIDKATVEVWKKHGFDGGWMRTVGGSTWLSSEYPKQFDDAVPAMWARPSKRGISDDDLKDLPQVDVIDLEALGSL